MRKVKRKRTKKIKAGRESYVKVFQDTDKLIEMLELYKKGWGLSELGVKYGIDHSSIHYQVKKNLGKTHGQIREVNAKVRASRRYEVHIPPITEKDRVKGVVPECQGRDYKDYIKANIQKNKEIKPKCIVCSNVMRMVPDPETHRLTGYNWRCDNCASGKMRKYTSQELHNMDFNKYKYEAS